jgi:hypothetical protein
MKSMALIVGLGIGGAFASNGWAQDTDSAVDVAADNLIKEMSAHLSKQASFSFEAEILYDIAWGGGDGDWDLPAEKTTVVRTGKVTVRRPDRFLVDVSEADRKMQYIYDGKSFVLSDSEASIYVKKAVPGTIDEVIPILRDTYDADPPLSDLLQSDLYKSQMDGVESASYLGKTRLRNMDVHHIAFASEGMDWQVWITADDKPVPVLLQILQRDQLFWPLYQAWFTNWEFGQSVPDSTFTFVPPDGSSETHFVEDVEWDSEASK